MHGCERFFTAWRGASHVACETRRDSQLPSIIEIFQDVESVQPDSWFVALTSLLGDTEERGVGGVERDGTEESRLNVCSSHNVSDPLFARPSALRRSRKGEGDILHEIVTA